MPALFIKWKRPASPFCFWAILATAAIIILTTQVFEMKCGLAASFKWRITDKGVTDYFYSMIDDIRVCLYAAPKWVFDNDENGKGVNTSNLDTMHTRDLMRERGVRYSFHAIDKDVRLG